jgi:hypothetical protein
MHVARQGLIVMRLSSLGIELDAAKVWTIDASQPLTTPGTNNSGTAPSY